MIRYCETKQFWRKIVIPAPSHIPNVFRYQKFSETQNGSSTKFFWHCETKTFSTEKRDTLLHKVQKSVMELIIEKLIENYYQNSSFVCNPLQNLIKRVVVGRKICQCYSAVLFQIPFRIGFAIDICLQTILGSWGRQFCPAPVHGHESRQLDFFATTWWKSPAWKKRTPVSTSKVCLWKATLSGNFIFIMYRFDGQVFVLLNLCNCAIFQILNLSTAFPLYSVMWATLQSQISSISNENSCFQHLKTFLEKK